MSIDFNELIWAIINFLVMLVVLYIFLWKPVLRALDKRRDEINENLSNAEFSKKEAEEMLVKYKEQIDKAGDEAREIINIATQRAEDVKNQILSESEDKAAKILEMANQDIQREKERALKEVRDEVATLAVMAAGKVLEKNITKEDHNKMIQEFLTEVGDVQ